MANKVAFFHRMPVTAMILGNPQADSMAVQMLTRATRGAAIKDLGFKNVPQTTKDERGMINWCWEDYLLFHTFPSQSKVKRLVQTTNNLRSEPTVRNCCFTGKSTNLHLVLNKHRDPTKNKKKGGSANTQCYRCCPST